MPSSPRSSSGVSRYLVPALSSGLAFLLSCGLDESRQGFSCDESVVEWGKKMEGEVVCIRGQEARVFKPEGWGKDRDGDGIADGFNAWYVLHGSGGAFLDKEGNVLANDMRTLTEVLLSDPGQNNMVIVVDQYSSRGYFPKHGSDLKEKPTRDERLEDMPDLIAYVRQGLEPVFNGKVGVVGPSQGGEVAAMHALGYGEGELADFYMSFYGGCGFGKNDSKNQSPLAIASSDPNKDGVVKHCPDFNERVTDNNGVDFYFEIHPGSQHGFLRTDEDPEWNPEDLYAKDESLKDLMWYSDQIMETDYKIILP